MPKQMKLSAPEALEKKILKLYPTLDEYTAFMLEAKEEMGWPDWCYLPMSASFAMVTNGAEPPFAQMYMANKGHSEMLALSAIIPWRLFKVIYRFDEILSEELNAEETEINKTPVALLHHMPYPCVFIETPPHVHDCEGVFFFLEWDHRYPSTTELRAHYLFSDDEIISIYHQWSDDMQALVNDTLLNNLKTEAQIGELPDPTEQSLQRYSECSKAFLQHLNMLLYLCSDEPDIKRKETQPRRKGHHIQTASYPDKFDVGLYIGSTIRKAKAEAKERIERESHDGHSVRPHVRRAHWHLYWTGEGRKTPKLLWVSPVFVHPEAGESGTVIHPVK